MLSVSPTLCHPPRQPLTYACLSYRYAPAMRRYGHSIKVIHFIGANKPWNRLHRDRPSPSTSLDDVHSYGALVSLWFDVFERHYGQRSTASLIDKSPSSQRPQADFHVPQYTNAWASSADVGYQPPDPADLQSMFGKRSQILDQYSAQGFKPDGQYRAPSPPPGYSTHDTLTATSELPALSSPTAHTQQSAPMASPPKSPWDAAHEEPDKTHMQMEHPMDHHYDNAWDLNTRESNLFFKVPTYQAVPSSIQQNYASVMQHSRGPPSAIFPWEDASTPSRLQPTRIFPEETTPQPARDAASSPPLLALTLSSPSPSQRRSVEASANSAPAQVLGGLPRDLGFKNAWDAIPSIKQKVNRSWPMSDEFFYPRDPESRLTAQDYRSLQRRQSESDSSSTAHDGDDEDEDEDEDAETARVLASMKQRPSFGTQFNRKPLKLLMNRGSPIQNTVPLPTPDVDAPPHMPGNLLSVHRRRISLTETSTRGQGPRHRSFRSPLPSLGVKPSSQGLPNPVAKRVFHPATDTNVIKKEGEAAYNRYINILETKGQTESQARRSSIKSPLVSAPSNPPSILA